MPEQETGRKDESAVVAIPTDEARDNLGPLILRAGFGNERIPLSYHGELRAYLVGLKDVERLRSLDAVPALSR